MTNAKDGSPADRLMSQALQSIRHPSHNDCMAQARANATHMCDVFRLALEHHKLYDLLRAAFMNGYAAALERQADIETANFERARAEMEGLSILRRQAD